MERYAALLRGVNVGGKNKLPMKELAELVRFLGAADVGTFIQSGNVVFSASEERAANLPGLLEQGMLSRFNVRSPVVLRSAADMERIVDGNPFLAAGQSDEQLHVVFLKECPTAEAVSALDPDRSPPDRFIVVGADIYLHTPNGQANTKLTNAYFDSRLKTVSTGRNWRTTVKLLELLRR
ncbi:MAG TPA: DUF1697 domain-containing protein [Fimbriimonadaceae bacterium]|nr:DUF1697 domain-containing protein [Fimbriimonadaceae bacterium]